MARFNTSGLDDVIREMTSMGMESGEVADEMLMVGAEQVKEAWKTAARMNNHIDTGDMFNSIGYARKTKIIGDVRSIDIYPQGKDRKGVRNAEKAFILHYGTSRHPGSHWVDDADTISEQTAIPAMVEVWDKFIKAKG